MLLYLQAQTSRLMIGRLLVLVELCLLSSVGGVQRRSASMNF